MIEIDGSEGEGGGQMLRTAVAMSAVTTEPFRITNIRAKRDNPGLAAQHLSAVKAVADLCSADVAGLSIGSRNLEFIPGVIRSGRLNVDVGTAGSVTLVLQALLFPAFHSREGLKVQVRGGTDVRWSPPADFLRYVTLPILGKLGFHADLVSLERGYYPQGGGKIVLDIKPSGDVREINLLERGKILTVKGVSHASKALEQRLVTERQAKSARTLLYNVLSNSGYSGDLDMQTEYNPSLSIGSGITLWAETEHSIIGADALGEQNKRAELVGNSAAQGLIDEISSGAPLDRHMTDQIIPYLALAGGAIRVGELSSHAITNMGVVNKFGFSVSVEDGVMTAKKNRSFR